MGLTARTRIRIPACLVLAIGLSCCLAACGAWKGPLDRGQRAAEDPGHGVRRLDLRRHGGEREAVREGDRYQGLFHDLRAARLFPRAADDARLRGSRRHLSHAVHAVVPRQRDRPGEVVHRPDGGRMDETPEAGVASRRLVQGPRVRPDRLGRHPGMGLHLQRQDLPAAGPLRAADVRGVRGGLRADQAGRHRAHLRARGQPLAHVPHVLRDGLHVRAARSRPLRAAQHEPAEVRRLRAVPPGARPDPLRGQPRLLRQRLHGQHDRRVEDGSDLGGRGDDAEQDRVRPKRAEEPTPIPARRTGGCSPSPGWTTAR